MKESHFGIRLGSDEYDQDDKIINLHEIPSLKHNRSRKGSQKEKPVGRTLRETGRSEQ